jgi:predicted RNase H-related nuclease YkuK (DUF458 family)
MQHLEIDKLKEFIDAQGPDTKVYIGCDSFRRKIDGVWYAYYTTVVVVHMNGRNGCRVFGDIQKERDYDQNKSRPAMRLMNEVYKATATFEQLLPIIGDREVELHLDINPRKIYGSSCVVDQAIGYVRGVAGIMPKVKPDGWAATHCADHFRTHQGRS